jgi:hypothetical protein
MVAPEVRLIKENDRELYFAHRPMAGVLFMLIGLGIVYFFSSSSRVSELSARWIFGAGGALFALAGFGGALWRYELRLDLMSRAYHGRKGFWPNPRSIRGSLDDLEGVSLTSRVDRSDKSTYTVWSVGLAFRTWQKPVIVMESQNEVKAYETLEGYAKKLRIPALDRTGGQERPRTWTELDMPLKDQPDRPQFIPSLPSQSRIEFFNRPGSRSITLPGSGPSFAGFFLILFGTPFLGGGILVLGMLLFGDPERMHGPAAVGWAIGVVFMLVGAFVMFLGVAGMWGRPVIEEDGAAVKYSLMLFGKKIWSQRLLKQEIEEVSVRQGRNERHELMLRSNRKIVRMQGLEQSGQELEWLRVAVSVIVGG